MSRDCLQRQQFISRYLPTVLGWWVAGAGMASGCRTGL